VDLTHYEVLGIDPDAEEETIRAAYKTRARETHPDVGGDHDDFVAVAAAWATLSDPDARARYDSGLGGSDDDGWGEDVGLRAAAPRTPAPRTAGRPDQPSGERVDAWTSGPRALPSVADELAWLPPAVREPSPVVWFVSAMVWIAVVAVVTLSIHDAAGGRGAGVLVLALALGLVHAGRYRRDTAMALRTSRIGAAVILWSCVALYPLLVWISVVDPSTMQRAPVPVFATALGMAGCLVTALLAERAVRRARRWFPAAAAMQQRRELAEAWDAFLVSRDLLGDLARVEQRLIPGHWRAVPQWALVRIDDEGLLASAPLEAPEAWAATLRLAGVDAYAAPGQRARA
jgi:hypothetical protein